MLTISNTSHQHHEAIQATIDRFPALADSIRVEPAAALTPGLKDAHAFLVGQLLPHMEMAEANLYPALEALLSDTKAMQPMRREHLEVRRLVDELGKAIHHLHDPISPGDMVALRRVLFRLFAIVRSTWARSSSTCRRSSTVSRRRRRHRSSGR